MRKLISAKRNDERQSISSQRSGGSEYKSEMRSKKKTERWYNKGLSVIGIFSFFGRIGINQRKVEKETFQIERRRICR
jgi:hypothetical protein